jgi:CheY-like chemotaxis protein
MSRVLLIDDDQLLLTALPAVFEGSPCVVTVDIASSAEQALRLVQATEYDTIVSDFSMPGLNGIEFLKECQAVRPDIPIILLTGYGTLELEEKAFEEGAYGLIQKPVNADMFLSVVARAMIRREIRRVGLTPKSPTSVSAQMFALENKRVSSRLRDIDERLRRQIKDAVRGTPSNTLSARTPPSPRCKTPQRKQFGRVVVTVDVHIATLLAMLVSSGHTVSDIPLLPYCRNQGADSAGLFH